MTSQIAIAAPLGLSAFLAFCVLRTKWSHFYMALLQQRGVSYNFATADTNVGSKLPALTGGLLSWIPQVWKITDDQVLEAAGLDAYVVCLSYSGTLIS